MFRLRERLDHYFYPDIGRDWDELEFRLRVMRAAVCYNDADLLDVGAGRGCKPNLDWSGLGLTHVAGCDPDPIVENNPYLNEGRAMESGMIPFDDESFDIVVSSSVLEHVERVGPYFQEIHRVLRPGGRFLLKTPNMWHYVAMISALTPEAFHRWVNRMRGRPDVDTFPTFYRCNTPRTIERGLLANGFMDVKVEGLESRPEYARISPAIYPFGIAYESS